MRHLNGIALDLVLHADAQRTALIAPVLCQLVKTFSEVRVQRLLLPPAVTAERIVRYRLSLANAGTHRLSLAGCGKG